MAVVHQNIQKISVEDFVKKLPPELNVEVLAGDEGLREREISSARIQKLGLALAGFSHYVHSGRVQIVGQSEISYLIQLESLRRIEVLENLRLENICCILITKNLVPPPELISIADEKKLPVVRTPIVSSTAIGLVSNFLTEQLAPQTTIHGVLMELYGLGVLLLGNSGIGKSECALDLISRGHRLISDDSIILKRFGKRLEGGSPEFSSAHLEIRGLGIINIRDLFGVSAVGKKKQVNLCIELKIWKDVVNIDRLGLETDETEIFGVNIPKFVLPVSSGRNLAVLVETAVRVFLLRIDGINAARTLIEKHSAMISDGK